MHTPHPNEEYLLPQVEALMAGTLALMTGLARLAGHWTGGPAPKPTDRHGAGWPAAAPGLH